MNDMRKKTIGYGVLVSGMVLAPLLPFAGLAAFPLIAVACGAHVAAIVFSVLVDSLFLPSGASIWTSLTFYTIPGLLFYAFLKHISRI